MKLTEEETTIVWQVLKHSPKRFNAMFDYGVYVLPTALFAMYGTWKADFIAMLVAYLALLLAAVLYLSHSYRSVRHLRTALEKYESEVGTLKGGEKK